MATKAPGGPCAHPEAPPSPTLPPRHSQKGSVCLSPALKGPGPWEEMGPLSWAWREAMGPRREAPHSPRPGGEMAPWAFPERVLGSGQSIGLGAQVPVCHHPQAVTTGKGLQLPKPRFPHL